MSLSDSENAGDNTAVNCLDTSTSAGDTAAYERDTGGRSVETGTPVDTAISTDTAIPWSFHDWLVNADLRDRYDAGSCDDLRLPVNIANAADASSYARVGNENADLWTSVASYTIQSWELTGCPELIHTSDVAGNYYNAIPGKTCIGMDGAVFGGTFDAIYGSYDFYWFMHDFSISRTWSPDTPAFALLGEGMYVSTWSPAYLDEGPPRGGGELLYTIANHTGLGHVLGAPFFDAPDGTYYRDESWYEHDLPANGQEYVYVLASDVLAPGDLCLTTSIDTGCPTEPDGTVELDADGTAIWTLDGGDGADTCDGCAELTVNGVDGGSSCMFDEPIADWFPPEPTAP